MFRPLQAIFRDAIFQRNTILINAYKDANKKVQGQIQRRTGHEGPELE